MRGYRRSFLQEPRAGEEKGYKLADLPIPEVVPSTQPWYPPNGLPRISVGGVVYCGTHRTPAVPPRRRPAHSVNQFGPAAGRSGPAGCQDLVIHALWTEKPGCTVGPAPTAVSVWKEGCKKPSDLLDLYSIGMYMYDKASAEL